MQVFEESNESDGFGFWVACQAQKAPSAAAAQVLLPASFSYSLGLVFLAAVSVVLLELILV